MTRPDLEREVIQFLVASGTSYRPNELVTKLAADHHAPESEVREALWRLLDRKQVQLTPDLELAHA